MEVGGRPPLARRPHRRWQPIKAGKTELRPIAAIPVTRYRYRGSQIPSPWVGKVHREFRLGGGRVGDERQDARQALVAG